MEIFLIWIYIKDGLHLRDLSQDGLRYGLQDVLPRWVTLERGKCLLAKNFIFVLNNFLNIHTHHPLLNIRHR